MFEEHVKGLKDSGLSRREFVGMAVAATVAVGTENLAWAVDSKTGMTYRTLGRTGEKVSMMGLGGYHIGNQKDEQESIKIIRTAVDNGVNFLDNCWDYNGGESEVRMGKALRDGYRQRAFLMTKIDGRTRKAATEQLEESLRRLQTDHIDLLQFHEIIRMGDPEKVFAPGAGMEAIVEAQKAGKVRYIGFTGHKSPDIHLKMLETAEQQVFTYMQWVCSDMAHRLSSPDPDEIRREIMRGAERLFEIAMQIGPAQERELDASLAEERAAREREWMQQQGQRSPPDKQP